MFTRQLLRSSALSKFNMRNPLKSYTVIVERVEKVPLLKKGVDPRKYPLKSRHFQYRFVECKHIQKWGDVQLLLTEYVEGVGHKGELVNVPRHVAYYQLLPLRLAVYPTDEYLEMFEKDSEEARTKAKVSPYALKTKEEIGKMVLNIPMNMSAEWTLNQDHIRLALRYNKVMCPNESIIIPKELAISSKDQKSYEGPFFVEIKINDYLSANLQCKIVPINVNKLWEEFTIFQKTV